MARAVTAEAKERNDMRLRNTKLLLKRYRELKAHTSEAVFEALQAADEGDEEIALLMSKLGAVDLRVDAIRRTVTRTEVILRHVDKMLEVWRVACSVSPREEVRRRWRVVYSRYLAPPEEIETVEVIAEREHIDPRTVYKDIDAAAEMLSVYFFGVDGLFE